MESECYSFSFSDLSDSVTEHNTPHAKVILPLLLHKWISNFLSDFDHPIKNLDTDSMPC